MNQRQKLFVKHYLIDPNATKAAIAAGYSEKTAAVKGSQLLKIVKVRKAIETGQASQAEKLDISANRVLRELALMGFSNMLDYMQPQSDGSIYADFSKLTREQAAAIQEITVEEYVEGKGETARDIKRTRFKLADKRGSLELLGKHLKIFTDRVEHSGTIFELGEVEQSKQDGDGGELVN